ncbi:MAG TPA: type II toxin-antitoxin system RelE/ParE family toxin [Verrucomicrobiae bacterium]|jgi:plasmid stabilization system protein ParE
MSFRVVIEDEAEREFAEAVVFYDEHEPGVGQRFAKELQKVFKTVCQDPDRFSFASRLTQKAKMPEPWPYSIYFVVKRKTSEVIISTIWHGARNPAELRRRLK